MLFVNCNYGQSRRNGLRSEFWMEKSFISIVKLIIPRGGKRARVIYQKQAQWLFCFLFFSESSDVPWPQAVCLVSCWRRWIEHYWNFPSSRIQARALLHMNIVEIVIRSNLELASFGSLETIIRGSTGASRVPCALLINISSSLFSRMKERNYFSRCMNKIDTFHTPHHLTYYTVNFTIVLPFEFFWKF